jgi:hypothetical protein
LGDYGPQLQLVPGPLPQDLTATRRVEDQEAFLQLIQFCFGLSVERTSTIWTDLLQDLRDRKALSQQQMESHHAVNPQQLQEWRDALDQLSHGLKHKRPQHVLAQMANELKQGRSTT